MASLGQHHMSLLDAARDDVIFALRQHKEMKQFVQGQRTSGTGASVKSRAARSYREGMKKAAAYAQELDAAAASDDEHVVMPADRMRQRPRRRKDNDRKKEEELETVVSSDDEYVYMASSGTH